MSTLADLIEIYIKQQLKQSEDQAVEISRAQLAETFSCVPSQINYVLTTRFTLDRGYLIESRRGGGGYIRVVQTNHQGKNKVAAKLFQQIGHAINQRDAEDLLLGFHDLEMISLKQLQLVRGILQRETGLYDLDKDHLRASLLRSMLFIVVHQ